MLLIRPRLPPRQRSVIASALGADVPFRFYEVFNDAVFIAAAAASAAGLLAQHRRAAARALCAPLARHLRVIWAPFGHLGAMWAFALTRCAVNGRRRWASRAEALAGGGAEGGGGLAALGLRGGGGSASKRATD